MYVIYSESSLCSLFNINLYNKDLSEDHGEMYSIAMVDACPDLKQKVSLYV